MIAYLPKTTASNIWVLLISRLSEHASGLVAGRTPLPDNILTND